MINQLRCVIMRGSSGSGKDWWIKNHVPTGVRVVSADDYFLKDGVYRFDPDRLPEAHDSCLREFVAAINRCHPSIVVNNTNIKAWEIAPYYRLAQAYGYVVEIIWMIADPRVCLQRNQHGTPESVIRSMIHGMDALPPWWNMRLVFNSERNSGGTEETKSGAGDVGGTRPAPDTGGSIAGDDRPEGTHPGRSAAHVPGGRDGHFTGENP